MFLRPAQRESVHENARVWEPRRRRDRECPGCPRSSTPGIFLKDQQTLRRNSDVRDTRGQGEAGFRREEGDDGRTRERFFTMVPREIEGKNRTARIRRQITAAYERLGREREKEWGRKGERSQKNLRVQFRLSRNREVKSTKRPLVLRNYFQDIANRIEVVSLC